MQEQLMVHLNFMASQLYWESSEPLHVDWSQSNSNSVYNRLRTTTRFAALTFPWFRVNIMFLTAGDSGESFGWSCTDKRWQNQLQRFLILFGPFIDCFMTFSTAKKWKMHFCLVTLFTAGTVLNVKDFSCLGPWDIYWLTNKWATWLSIPFHNFLLIFSCP